MEAVKMETPDIDALEEQEQENRYLTFYLDDEFYGIEIKLVTEIIGIQPITAVPEVPGFVKGIINLRGKLIPVIDIRMRFNKPFAEYNDRTCIIVIEKGELILGLIVDGVSEVLEIPSGQVILPPDVYQEQNHYIKGIGKVGEDVKLILDCDRIFDEKKSD